MKKTKPKKKTVAKKSSRNSGDRSVKKASRKNRDRPAKKAKSKKSAAKEKSSSEKESKKSSFKPNPDKLAFIRQSFVTVLWKHEALPPERVREILQNEIANEFPTEFADYFNHVNELLTKFRLVEEVPHKKPLHIRLTQRLEQ
jgi:hypothetical protein